MDKRKNEKEQFYIKEWLKSMKLLLFFSIILSLVLIISSYFLLSDSEFINFKQELNSVLRDGAFVLIASLFAMIAIFQAIRSSDNNKIIVKLTQTEEFKIVVSNEYYTVVTLALIIVSTMFFRVVDSFENKVAIITYLSLETIAFFNCLLLCMRHFKIITRLFV